MTERSDMGHGQESLLTITEAAKARLLSLMEKEGRQGQGVRVFIHGHGPASLQYGITFVEQGQEGADDGTVIDCGAFKLFIDSESAPKLEGATIDYVDDPFGGGGGFKIDNPVSPWTDPTAQAIQELIDTQINPGVASHGGYVELLDVKDNVVYIQVGGGCQGCGMVDVTLKQGVEVMIKEAVPEIEAVVDATDHAAGTNPYYQPAKGGESPLAPPAD